MKKLIGTLVVLFCLSTLGLAQFTKGKFMAGGSFNTNFNSYSNGGVSYKSTSINFFPQVGYFIVDNLAGGAGLSLSYSNYKKLHQAVLRVSGHPQVLVFHLLPDIISISFLARWPSN